LIDYGSVFFFFGRCFQVHGSALYDNKNTYWHPVHTGRPWEFGMAERLRTISVGLFGGSRVADVDTPTCDWICRRTQFGAF
jgi:hypothetical protein